MKPQTIIFSSSQSFNIAQAIHENLKDKFLIHLWKGDFFGENRTTPLWTFFKKLFNYDYAILILSDDNIIQNFNGTHDNVWVPKDNVIFELGATMARLGPQKTILIVPDEPFIHLPGYFDDVLPHKFTYKNIKSNSIDGNRAATRNTAESIAELMDNIDYSSFHSELPAQGLAHAYVHNFLSPALDMEEDQVFEIKGTSLLWKKDNGIILSIIIPEEIMGRRDADAYFQKRQDCYNITIKMKGGRHLSVYALSRKDANSPLHILDIPTTLFTAGEIIESIEQFWRQKDSEKVLEKDLDFSDTLKKREILNFSRSLENMLKDKSSRIFFVDIANLSEHISKL